MKRLFLILTVLLLCLTGLAVYHRNTLLEHLLGLALDRLAMENVAYTITGSGINHLDIGKLQAVLPDSGVRFQMRSIHLAWNRASLAHRQLQEITIDSARIVLAAPSQPKKSTSPQPAELLDRARQALTRPMPRLFNHLRLRSLRVHAPSLPWLDKHNLAIDLQQNGQGQRLRITDRDSALSSEFMLRPGELILHLETDAGAPIVQGNIRYDSGLQYTLHLALGQLDQAASLLPFTLPTLQGELAITGSARIDSSQLAVQLQATLKQARLQDMSIGKAVLQLDARTTASHLVFDQTSRLRITSLRKDKSISLDSLELPLAAELRWQDGWTLTPRPGQQVRLTAITGPDMLLDSTVLSLPARIAYDEQLRIDLAEAAQYAVTGLRGNNVQIKNVSLTGKTPCSLILHTGQPISFQMTASRWQLTAHGLTAGGFTITPDPVQISMASLVSKGSDTQFKSFITTPALHIQNRQNGLRLHDLRLHVQTDQGQVELDGDVRPGQLKGILRLQGQHGLKTGKGQLNVVSRPSFTFSDKAPLSSLVDRWSLPLDLRGGSLLLTAQASWPRLSLSTRLRITDGTGIIRNIPFSGLDTDLRLALLPKLKTLAPARITVQQVDGPVRLDQFATTLRIRPGHGPLPRIILRDSRVGLLGGSLENSKVSIDLNRPEVETVLTVNHLHLADLLALQQVKDLAVDGVVSGELPIRYDKNGLRVKAGKLTNLPPGGIIRYTPRDAAAMQASPLTGIALKALEEFHYKLLSATADYQPDGTLRVNLHLEGTSPRLDTRRPVHLNINTEQNILSLLESLRYSQTLTDEIDKRIERHFHPHQSR